MDTDTKRLCSVDVSVETAMSLSPQWTGFYGRRYVPDGYTFFCILIQEMAQHAAKRRSSPGIWGRESLTENRAHPWMVTTLTHGWARYANIVSARPPSSIQNKM